MQETVVVGNETRAFRITEDTDPIEIGVLQEEAKDETLCHLVCTANRPGITRFLTSIEYGLFPPGTDRADKFEMSIVVWERTPFWVVSFPIEYAMELGLYLNSAHLVREVGVVPTLFDDGGNAVSYFPLRGKTVYTLSTSPDHPLYSTEEGKERAFYLRALEEEDRVWCSGVRREYLASETSDLSVS